MRYEFLNSDNVISLNPYNSALNFTKNLKLWAYVWKMVESIPAKFHVDWLRLRVNGKINLPILGDLFNGKISLK